MALLHLRLQSTVSCMCPAEVSCMCFYYAPSHCTHLSGLRIKGLLVGQRVRSHGRRLGQRDVERLRQAAALAGGVCAVRARAWAAPRPATCSKRMSGGAGSAAAVAPAETGAVAHAQAPAGATNPGSTGLHYVSDCAAIGSSSWSI